jgi:radical SAM superfamily enzyme YgiQ (UPF0313 family)
MLIKQSEKIRILLLNAGGKKFIKEGRCQYNTKGIHSPFPPLTLAFIASLLRKNNHEVKLLDAIGERKTLKNIPLEVKRFKPHYVIMSVTTPTIEDDLLLLKKIKSLCKCKTVIFGIHATYFARDLIKLPWIDIVIKGEPELTASELIKNKLKNVRGILFKENGKIVENPPRDFLNLNKLPYPAWDLIKLKNYTLPFSKKPFLIILTGRGCPYNCSFCTAPYYYGRIVRKRKVRKITEEIEWILKNFGVRNFFFFEENFTSDRRFVLKLCDELIKKKLNIKWICNSRVDTIDKDMIKKMKQAGCWLISFGIESPNKNILTQAKKEITRNQIKEAIHITKSAGIITNGIFILGLPGENIKTVKETIEFAKNSHLDFAEFAIATPFPGSPLYEEYKNKLPKNWKKYEYFSQVIPSKLNLKKWQLIAYLKFYFRLTTLKNILHLWKICT